MKINLKLALSTLALVLAASPFVRAQDNTVTVPVTPAPTADAPVKKGGKGAGKGLKAAVEQHDQQLADKLKLTDDQKQKLAALRKEQAEALKAAKGDRTKLADLRKTSHDQVRALLTPEQQKDFDAMPVEGRPAKGKKAAKN